MKKLFITLCSFIAISCAQKENIENVTIEQEIPGIKLMATVQIQNRLEHDELKEYAEKIYSNYNGDKYENVFIKYMLPNMIDGTGSYATTHYNPNLEISIYEMTNAEIGKVKSHFKIKQPYWIEGKILIQFKKVNEKYFMKQYANDLSTGEEEVIRQIKNNV